MSVIQQSILVTNHTNWELSFEDSPRPKETRLGSLATLVGSTVVWPIFLIGGALALTFHSINYFRTRWNQHKIISILSNHKNLHQYAEKRIRHCEKQIENLKSHAMFLMEKYVKKPHELGLQIPQKKEWKDQFSSRLPKSYWNHFAWNNFLSTDFFQKSNIPNISDKKTLIQLEQVRIKLNRLSQQKAVLSSLNGNERLEVIKKIAEFSFVKNGFKRQASKEWVSHSILWLLPSGVFWDLNLNSRNNDRLTYEKKKHFLPSTTNFAGYEDLVDAHNKLVRNHNFLVPYIEHKIV